MFSVAPVTPRLWWHDIYLGHVKPSSVVSLFHTKKDIQYWIIEDKTFYAINIAANMVISSQKFFKADRYRYRYVVPIFFNSHPHGANLLTVNFYLRLHESSFETSRYSYRNSNSKIG